MIVVCFKWYCKLSLVVFPYLTYHPLTLLMGKNIYFVILWIVLKKLLMTGASLWHLIPKPDGAETVMCCLCPRGPYHPQQFHTTCNSQHLHSFTCGEVPMTPGWNRDWKVKSEGEGAGPINSVLCASSNRHHPQMFTELLLSCTSCCCKV